MAEEQVYIQFSPEVRALLSESDIDLQGRIRSELEKEPGVKAEVKFSKNPTSVVEDKELVLLILAAGATAWMVGNAVKTVIDSISRQRYAAIQEKHLEPAVDGHGNAIVDAYGEPVYKYSSGPGGPPPQGEAARAYVKTALFEVGLSGAEAAGTGKKG